MAKTLHSPDQPLLVQWGLRLFAFAASLKLAVVLIFSCAAALAWATFVESEYGTPAVQFGVYGSWWFALLNLLLAINIFAAAAIRFPWKRYQTGFVITHLGLLTLLYGCLISRQRAIDAQMPIFEDAIGAHAYTDAHHVQLKVEPTKPAEDELAKVVEIPFNPGPFNWDGYGELFQGVAGGDEEKPWYDRMTGRASLALKNMLRATTGLAFATVPRDHGLIFDQDGIQVEVLDYYADSTQVDAPLVNLKLSMPQGTEMGPDGKPQASRLTWVPVPLRILSMPLADFPHGLGTAQARGGGSFTFRVAGSDQELAAFRASRPQGELGPQGQVTLHLDGQSHKVDLAELLAAKQKDERLKLGEGAIEVELVEHLEDGTLGGSATAGRLALIANPGGAEQSRSVEIPTGPALELKIHRGKEKTPARLILFARHPEASVMDHTAEVYGVYWQNVGELTAAERMQGKAGTRIDLVQGPDQKLYYRHWNGQEVVALDELATDGAKVDAFKMPIAQLQMYVDDFVPSAKPRKVERPLPFSREKPITQKRPAAQLRVTVDGKAEEFWLAGLPVQAFINEPTAGEIAVLSGKDRKVTVTLPPQDMFQDVGFQVRLKQFQRKLDPGTSQASHYGSTIDILARDPQAQTPESDPKVMQSDVEISMNAPIDIVDPATGRTLRLFQESFQGPWSPGEPIYNRFANKSAGRELFYASVLTVNYDPGRGVKYLGCLLIVAGIFTMFYMRAYSLKPIARKLTASSKSKSAPMQPVSSK